MLAWWILFPAYAANMFPVFAKGRTPIDLRQKLVRHRIFGSGKTYKGFLLGIFAGTCVGGLEAYLYPSLNAYANTFGIQIPYMSLTVGFMIALGALVGDLVGSFIKRRLALKRGKEVPLLDQLNFIIGAIVFSYFLTDISFWMILIMLIITPIVHRTACIIGYHLKVKREPW